MDDVTAHMVYIRLHLQNECFSGIILAAFIIDDRFYCWPSADIILLVKAIFSDETSIELVIYDLWDFSIYSRIVASLKCISFLLIQRVNSSLMFDITAGLPQAPVYSSK